MPDTTVSADGAHGLAGSQRHTERVRGGKATGGRGETAPPPLSGHQLLSPEQQRRISFSGVTGHSDHTAS